MNRSHAARLQSPQQLRGEEVHLLEELIIVRVVSEVVVAGAVLIVVAERNRGHIKVDAVCRPAPHLFHAVVVDGRIIISLNFHTLTSYRSFQGLQSKAAEAVFLDDLLHLLTQLVILPPLALEGQQNLRFSVHIQDVDDDRSFLQKAVDTMNGLDEVVKLIVHPHENCPMAESLEIASRAGQALFRAKDAGTALRKIHDALFAGLQLHAAIDVHHLRHSLFESLALIFEVVPDHKMLIGGSFGNDAGHLSSADVNAIALFLGSIRQPHRGIVAELHLAVSFKLRRAVKTGELVVLDVHRGQGVPFIRKTKVGRFLEEQPPAGAPNPELALAARIKGQVVRLGGIPFEKTSKGLPGVHDLQKTCIVNQLFIPVRGRRGRIGQLILDPLELQHKALVRLRAEAAQSGRFIQRNSSKAVRVNVTISDTLIVRQDNGCAACLHLCHRAAVGRFGHPQQIHGICLELRQHVQGHHNEHLSAFMFLQEAAPFELHDGLSQTKPGKDTPAAPTQCPQDTDALVVFQHRIDLGRVNLNARHGRDVNFLLQKLAVIHNAHPLSEAPALPHSRGRHQHGAAASCQPDTQQTRPELPQTCG